MMKECNSNEIELDVSGIFEQTDFVLNQFRMIKYESSI